MSKKNINSFYCKFSVFLKLVNAASNLVKCIMVDKKQDNGNDLETCTVLAIGLRRKAPHSRNSPKCSKWSQN